MKKRDQEIEELRNIRREKNQLELDKEVKKQKRHEEKLALYEKMQLSQIAAMKELLGEKQKKQKRRQASSDSE